jgi:PST family polysaccharide transporter
MQALAIYAALRSLGSGVVDLLKATGRPNATLLLAACRLVVRLPALLIGAQFGIEGVAWAQVAVALFFALVMQGIAGRVVHAGVLDLSKACAAPVLAGGSAALVALSVDRLLEASQPISLLASVLAGAAVAAMTLLVVSSQLRADATGLLHRLRRRSSPRQVPGS